MTKLMNWRIVGGAYTRNGQYIPGFKEVTIEGDLKTRFPDEVTMSSIIAALEAEGVDCGVFHDWVKTGEGASFSLS